MPFTPPYYLIALIWAVSCLPCPAQSAAVEFKKLVNGPIEMSQLEVMDIHQDRFGFIWFATNKGLLRYDGHDMKSYRENPLDPYSIGADFLRTIAEDASGDLWIGSGQGGLYKYLQRQEAFVSIPLRAPYQSSGSIYDLLTDRKGRLWCASRMGLECVLPETGQRQHYLDTTSMLYSTPINGLCEDETGRIWLATQGKGLQVLHPDTKNLEPFSPDPLTDLHANVLDVSAAPDGRIWFSTEAPALHCFDPATRRLQTYTFDEITVSGGSALFREIAIDQQGNVWLATWDNGLVHFVPATGQVNHYTRDPGEPHTISSNSIGALYFDQRQQLWLGFNGDGIDQLFNDDKGFDELPLQQDNQIPDFYPNYQCLLEDSRGIIWAGTLTNGLFRFDPHTQEVTWFKHQSAGQQGIASNMIWDLLEDREGFIWIATHNGLQKLDPASLTFTTYRSAAGLAEAAVRSVGQDHLGRIWIGTFEGLYLLPAQGETIRFVDEYFAHPRFIATDIFADSHRHLWVATFGRGLYRIDLENNTAVHYLHDENDLSSLSSNLILAVREDARGNIWIATQGGGLCRFIPKPARPDAASFRHWRTYNSALPDNEIFGLAPGTDQRLWLATYNGLLSFDTQSEAVDVFMPPGIPRRHRMVSRSASSGLLYTASGKKIYRFDPHRIRRNTDIPPVYITSMQINGEPLSIARSVPADSTTSFTIGQSMLFTEQLSLPYWQNDLTFTFSALNYVHPEKNRYKFKLEGYDDEWIETHASNRRIRYTNLAPGDYQFKVIASNNDGIWNESGKTLSIHISPPWWHTWWAYLTYAALFFFVIRTIYRFQLNRSMALNEARRLKELDRVKSRLFTNVTHEFRTPLTVILGMSQKIQEAPKLWLGEGLQAINRNGRQLLRLVNQMLDLSRLEAGNLPLVFQQSDVITYLSYLIQSQQSYAASKDIHLLIDKRVETLVMDYSADALNKIMNNLLSNAIKFTPADGEVIVTLDQLNDHLYIQVQDTGQGISPENLPFVFDRFYQADAGTSRPEGGTGIGLSLVKELVTRLNGHINIESTVGVGTRFQISLPITREAPVATAAAPDQVTDISNERSEAPVELPSASAESPLVLLVEDNEDVARYTAACLAGRYKVQVAQHGREGVDKALDLIPDLIICDVMMPEMDGYEVCRTLKHDERTSHIPIVMLTAKADMDSRLEGLRQGADAYLAKPFHPEELDLRLENLLQLRRRMGQHFERFPEKQAPDTEYPKEHAFLGKIRSILHAHLDEETFGIPELCRELGASRTQLHRKLKALTGRSTSFIIRSVRLQRARELLLQSEQSVTQIAYQVGFGNPSYFSAVFAEEFGMSPTEMREKHHMKQ